VERRRIAAVAAIEKNRAKERGKLEGVRLEKQRQAEARAAKQEARRENVQMHTARDVDKQVRYRNGLLRFAAAKLRTVDAEGSAELIAMIDDVLRAEQRKDERRISDSEKLT
jgi:hypothetical protein